MRKIQFVLSGFALKEGRQHALTLTCIWCDHPVGVIYGLAARRRSSVPVLPDFGKRNQDAYLRIPAQTQKGMYLV